MAAAEGGLLEADASVFNTGDYAVGTDADEGDDGGAPAFDFGFEALAAGAKFVGGELIGAVVARSTMLVMPNLRSRSRDSSNGKRSAGVAAGVEGGPEAVAGAAEVAADGGGV